MTRRQTWAFTAGFVILAVFCAVAIYQTNGVANDAEQLAKENRRQRMILEEQVEALEAESEQRQTADRIIAVKLCQDQRFLHRVLRGLIEADSREVRGLLRRRAVVLRANGLTRGELRRAIARNQRVLSHLRPLDCRTFADTVTIQGVRLSGISSLFVFGQPSAGRLAPSSSGVLGTTAGGSTGGNGPPGKPGPAGPPGPPAPPPVTPPAGPGKGKACQHAKPGKNKHC